LQVLGHYLDYKQELGQHDGAFVRAHRSLLAFAAWMRVHERPYLERRDALEYPTETWVAQDLRKADVFFWAARHTDGEEREAFVALARRYVDYVVRTLPTMPGHRYTRPLVLALTQGLRAALLYGGADWL